jgi:hypothetical protein
LTSVGWDNKQRNRGCFLSARPQRRPLLEMTGRLHSRTFAGRCARTPEAGAPSLGTCPRRALLHLAGREIYQSRLVLNPLPGRTDAQRRHQTITFALVSLLASDSVFCDHSRSNRPIQIRQFDRSRVTARSATAVRERPVKDSICGDIDVLPLRNAVARRSGRDIVRARGATRILFIDDPVVSGVTPIRGVHVDQARQAVDAVRVSAGLPRIWAAAPSVAGSTIFAWQFADLAPTSPPRDLLTALNQARQTLGLPLVSFAGLPAPAPGVAILQQHLKNLRDGVK